jgi:hypothetical protein
MAIRLRASASAITPTCISRLYQLVETTADGTDPAQIAVGA